MTRSARARGSGLALAALLLAGCSNGAPVSTRDNGDTGEGVVVGSFASPLSLVVAEIYAQALQAKGVSVQLDAPTGSRTQVAAALRAGAINLVPDRNGALLLAYDPDNPARTDAQVDRALADLVARDGLEVLDPAPAQDGDTYVVTRATAEAQGVTSLTDLARLGPLTLAGDARLTSLPWGLLGLTSTYAVPAGQVGLLPVGDGPAAVAALSEGRAQVAAVRTTLTADRSLVALADPEHLLPAQAVVPVLAQSVDRTEVTTTLDAVSAQLTTAGLAGLRHRVEGPEGAAPRVAARDWLADHDLV